MPAKIFVDTNVVVYALGPYSQKTDLVAPLFIYKPTVSMQVLSEAANVALKKLKMAPPDAQKLVTTLESLCRVELVTSVCINRAFDIAARYKFAWYDCLIVASALEAECDTLYTEDLHHGQVIDDQLSIINPFR